MRYIDGPLAPDTLQVWQDALHRELAGLDLRDPDDRVIFRTRVWRITEGTYVLTIRELARAHGRSPDYRSRASAVRTLADAVINSVLASYGLPPIS